MTSPALATRLRNTRLVQRDADVVAEVAAVLERRQADLATWLAARRVEVDERVRVAEEAELRFQERLATAETALVALSARVDQRDRARTERVTMLQAELETLRRLAHGDGGGSGNAVAGGSASSERVGEVLMYAGGLVLAWLVLWQLGLALGLG